MSRNQGRPLAPHVQAAIAAGQGVGQAKAVGAVESGRLVAAHVQAAITAGQGVGQAKAVVAGGQQVATHVQAQVVKAGSDRQVPANVRPSNVVMRARLESVRAKEAKRYDYIEGVDVEGNLQKLAGGIGVPSGISDIEDERGYFNFTVNGEYSWHINFATGQMMAHVSGGSQELRKGNYWYVVEEGAKGKAKIKDAPSKVLGKKNSFPLSSLPSDVAGPILNLLKAVYA